VYSRRAQTNHANLWAIPIHESTEHETIGVSGRDGICRAARHHVRPLPIFWSPNTGFCWWLRDRCQRIVTISFQEAPVSGAQSDAREPQRFDTTAHVARRPATPGRDGGI